MSSIFVIMLFALQLIYWIVGRRASRQISNKEDYFLAGKGVKLFPLTMTFLATQVGGGVILGASEEAYIFGWPILLYPLGTALGFILLGAGIGRRLSGFQVSTIAQIFELAYGSPILKKMASILSLAYLFMVLIAQIVGSHKFLVSMGFTSTPLFILFWGIVILYTSRGGLKAVISTDVVQALFFSGIFIICFCVVIFSEPAAMALPLPKIENFSDVSTKVCGWLLMPLLAIVIQQDMGQRCFAGASARVVSWAASLAGLGMLAICIIPIFFGTLANAMDLKIPEGGSVLMTAIAETTNPWFTALVGCAVLAAIVSTATSIINAMSSNLFSDFQLTNFKGENTMNLIKGITCVISFAAIIFAFSFNNVVDLLVQSYELSVSCLFVPIFIALFKRNGNFYAALFAMLFGLAGLILFRISPIAFPKEIAGILLSLLGYGCGEVIALAQEKKINPAKNKSLQ